MIEMMVEMVEMMVGVMCYGEGKELHPLMRE